ncbi:peptidase [Actinoplanes sp. SE50]|nr:peptidase S8/S53 subtilisin kexin sedolisin [Actinoplanes sp. SE50/110]ATO86087.1 peptidase [Actinoplanes sp. SE50]SLM03501.1 peptidase [Actinoplanes sp. SE50/110]
MVQGVCGLKRGRWRPITRGMRKWTLGALLTSAVAASAALLGPAPALAAGTVIGAELPGALPGRYIVTLKDRGTGPSVHSMGAGRLVRSFRSIPGFAAEMTAAQARRLAADPAVRSVEQDRMIHIATQNRPGWGLDRIDQRSATLSKTYTATDDGSAVHAYVIDTGIRITHSEFGGRASYGYDFADGDRVASDCNGHGTHVAGTIGGARYGVAKKVQLVAVRVLGCDGGGSISDVIDGVDWVTEHAIKPAVANMSMGGSVSRSLDYAVQESIASGVTYVVAAGNEDDDARWSSPADVPAAITVGATDSRDRRASFSNYGSGVDLFAPGVDIRSSVADSNTATDVYSGTSMAAPHVAGAAALLLDANPSLTPGQVRDRLVANATTGRVADRMGSPNRLLFVTAPPAKPVIATTRTAAAVVGTELSTRLALTANRVGSWTLAGGTLPPGLSLNRSGVLSGTPAQAGDYVVTVRFTDYVPQVVTRQVTIPVEASVPVIDPTLPDGQAGVYYEGQLTTADQRDGVWAVTAGALPAGLTLDEASGLISGVPSATGSFTVRFTDPWGQTATADFTITVGAA